jgi:hypothetical protein
MPARRAHRQIRPISSFVVTSPNDDKMVLEAAQSGEIICEDWNFGLKGRLSESYPLQIQTASADDATITTIRTYYFNFYFQQLLCVCNCADTHIGLVRRPNYDITPKSASPVFCQLKLNE